MKLNYFRSQLLLIFALIALSASSKLTRNAKNKDEGSGNYASGFICPFFEFSSKNGTQIDLHAKNVKFYPQDLEKQSNGYEHGFLFELTSKEDEKKLKRFAVKGTKDNTYYIPYRFFKADSVWNNQGNYQFKDIVSTLFNDNNEEFKFVIRMPYRSIRGMFYNAAEANKICQKINEHAISKRTQINSYISNILTEHSKLIPARNTLSNTKNKYSDFVNQEKAKKSQIEELKKKLEELLNKLNSNSNKIRELNSEVDKLKVENQSYQSEINDHTSTIQQHESITLELSSHPGNLENLIKETTENIKNLTDAIRESGENLKKIVPDKSSIVDSVLDAIKDEKTEYSNSKVSKELNSIRNI